MVENSFHSASKNNVILHQKLTLFQRRFNRPCPRGMCKHVKCFHCFFLSMLLKNLAYSFSFLNRFGIPLGCVHAKSNLVQPILPCNQTLFQFLNEGGKCHVCVIQHDLDTAMIGFGKIVCGWFIVQYGLMKIPYWKFKVTIFIATFLACLLFPTNIGSTKVSCKFAMK